MIIFVKTSFTAMLYLAAILAAAAAGATILYFAYRPLMKRNAQQEARLMDELSAKDQRINALNAESVEAATQIALLRERLEVHKEEAAAMAERQKAEFKNLANDILDEKSRQFRETNRESLETMLKPFSQNIEAFRKRVEEVYISDTKDRSSLQEQLRSLNEMNLRISSEANNLTAALKGNSKVQGDWGEMILESILDNSNLIKGVHYRTQANLKNEDGANLRPDVILSLPEGKEIIIDSKVSLTAFVAHCECDEAGHRSQLLRDHLKSVRSHIDELGSKRYQTLVNSPDFVIMFVPNEPAFLLALQNDTTLWNDAYDKKVIISSPTNLFALLKLVDDLWKRDNQSKNALAIASEGANLYDKLAGFAETLTDLGRSIHSAGDKYDKALNQLKTGRGNLISRAERLRDLGIKATKKLPAQMSDFEDEV